MERRNTVQTILQCSKCGNYVKIFRRKSRQRKPGHVKTMWCPYCQKVRDFTELKDFVKNLDGEIINA